MPPPPVFTSDCTLASFLNRPVRHRNRRSCSHSQPPHNQPVSASTSAPLYVPNPDIPLVNQSQPDGPVYPSISRFYSPQNVSLLPNRDTLPHREPPQEDLHRILVQSQELHCHFPEEIFLSSVLPSRTPRELRYFQDHCWQSFSKNRDLPPRIIHNLNKTRAFTTSPLNIENLYWRYSTELSELGITEEYYWIKRDVQLSRPVRPRLEPAYSVHYPWVGTHWKTTQLDRSQCTLPRTPVHD